jgi:hypothetical protein
MEIYLSKKKKKSGENEKKERELRGFVMFWTV